MKKLICLQNAQMECPMGSLSEPMPMKDMIECMKAALQKMPDMCTGCAMTCCMEWK